MASLDCAVTRIDRVTFAVEIEMVGAAVDCEAGAVLEFTTPLSGDVATAPETDFVTVSVRTDTLWLGSTTDDCGVSGGIDKVVGHAGRVKTCDTPSVIVKVVIFCEVVVGLVVELLGLGFTGIAYAVVRALVIVEVVDGQEYVSVA